MSEPSTTEYNGAKISLKMVIASKYDLLNITACSTWTLCASLPVSGIGSPGSTPALCHFARSAPVRRGPEMLSPHGSCPVNKETIKKKLAVFFFYIKSNRLRAYCSAYHTNRRDRHKMIFETSKQGSFQGVDP